MPYVLTGTETEVLVPTPGTGVPVWCRVLEFCWHSDESGHYPAHLVGVWPEGQGLRRAHVVLNGR
jgi:hypothetical protein